MLQLIYVEIDDENNNIETQPQQPDSAFPIG